MQLVVAALAADVDALSLLVAAWTAAGLPPERLYVVVDVRRVRLASLLDAPLDHLATHHSLALCSPPPEGEVVADEGAHRRANPRSGHPVRHLRRRRRRRRGLTLLARLADTGPRVDWAWHAHALDRGHGLGIARLLRDGTDALAMTRPLLDCAHGTVRVVDID